jgi:hypothetical protein
VGAMVEQKMAAMKTEIMQEIGVKMDESSKKSRIPWLLFLIYFVIGIK